MIDPTNTSEPEFGAPELDITPEMLTTGDASIAFDVETHAVQPGLMPPSGATLAAVAGEYTDDEHADDAEIVRQLKRDMPDDVITDIAGVAVSPHITAEFVNTTLRNVRAPFEAKMKRGKLYKAQRTKLTNQADAAVCEFRGKYLSELTDEQALRISLGITGLVGDSIQGFRYLDASEE